MKKYILFVQFPKPGETILNLAISIVVTSLLVAYRQNWKFETILVEDWFLNLLSFLMNTIFIFIFFVILKSWSFAKNLKKVPSLGDDLRRTIDSVFELVNNSDLALQLSNGSDKKSEKKEFAERAKKKQQESNHLAFCLRLAARGNRLIFDPHNTAIQQLHEIKGSISVTMADPSEWLNPTYSLFLLNHYISTLLNRIRSQSHRFGKLTLLKNRQNPKFRDFLYNQNQFLKKRNVSSLSSIMEGNHVRFYILDREVIEKHKGILETLIAGHELFGIYLFIVDSKIMDQLSVASLDLAYNILRQIDPDIPDQIDPEEKKQHLHKLDFMLSLHSYEKENAVKMTYRKDNELKSKTVADNGLECVRDHSLVTFLNDLKAAICSHNTLFIFPCEGEPQIEFERNDNNCHIYIELNEK